MLKGSIPHIVLPRLPRAALHCKAAQRPAPQQAAARCNAPDRATKTVSRPKALAQTDRVRTDRFRQGPDRQGPEKHGPDRRGPARHGLDRQATQTFWI